jgi:hypothetical protein
MFSARIRNGSSWIWISRGTPPTSEALPTPLTVCRRLDAVRLGEHFEHKARISEIVFYGNFYEVTLECENETLMAYSFDDSLSVGDTIGFEIDANRLIRFV